MDETSLIHSNFVVVNDVCNDETKEHVFNDSIEEFETVSFGAYYSSSTISERCCCGKLKSFPTFWPISYFFYLHFVHFSSIISHVTDFILLVNAFDFGNTNNSSWITIKHDQLWRVIFTFMPGILLVLILVNQLCIGSCAAGCGCMDWLNDSNQQQTKITDNNNHNNNVNTDSNTPNDNIDTQPTLSVGGCQLKDEDRRMGISMKGLNAGDELQVKPDAKTLENNIDDDSDHTHQVVNSANIGTKNNDIHVRNDDGFISCCCSCLCEMFKIIIGIIICCVCYKLILICVSMYFIIQIYRESGIINFKRSFLCVSISRLVPNKFIEKQSEIAQVILIDNVISSYGLWIISLITFEKWFAQQLQENNENLNTINLNQIIDIIQSASLIHLSLLAKLIFGFLALANYSHKAEFAFQETDRVVALVEYL